MPSGFDSPHYEVLPGLPPYGPPAVAFSANGWGTHSEAYVIRFTARSGRTWVGNFQPGLLKLTGIYPHPDAARFVVMAWGQGHIIDPEDPARVEYLRPDYDTVVSTGQLLLLVTLCEIQAIGPGGPAWDTGRIALDGIDDLKLSEDRTAITGTASTGGSVHNIPFSVNLATGTVTGGDTFWRNDRA